MDAVTWYGHEVQNWSNQGMLVKQCNGPLQNPANLGPFSKLGHVTEKWGTKINMLKRETLKLKVNFKTMAILNARQF